MLKIQKNDKVILTLQNQVECCNRIVFDHEKVSLARYVCLCGCMCARVPRPNACKYLHVHVRDGCTIGLGALS